MKKDLHPEYYQDAKIICACGHEIQIGSTQKVINVEICSSCHPFYTGKQKLVDTARRVDKFQKRLAEHQKVAGTRTTKKVKRAQKQAKKIARAKTSK